MARQRTEPTRTCIECGLSFNVRRVPHIVHGKIRGYRKTRQHFCSWECGHKHRPKPTGRPKGTAKPKHHNTTCDECGQPFFKHEAYRRRSVHHFCQPSCYAAYKARAMKGQRQPQLDANPPSPAKRKQAALKGSTNAAWQGGVTYRNRKGRYTHSIKYVRCPEAFISMARKDGYVMEHRLLMAQSIGRPLSRSEVVHHINHDPTDNRLENLQLFASNGEHKRHEGATGYFKVYYRTHTNRH